MSCNFNSITMVFGVFVGLICMVDDVLKKEIQACYSHALTQNKLKARAQQKKMIADVARALTSNAHSGVAVIEAGTGTGKTMAYLAACLPVAAAQDKTLVVSTATIALQEQLLHKDLPMIADAIEGGCDYQMAKGRRRYLCPLKLEDQISHSSVQSLFAKDDDTSTDKSVLNDLCDAFTDKSWDGDIDSWDDHIPSPTWQSVTTNHRECLHNQCPHFKNCPYYKNRSQLLEKQCVIVNHDLLLSDLQLGGGAILPPPEDCIYVIDEGHHIGDKALEHFQAQVNITTCKGLGERFNKLLAGIASVLTDEKSALNAIEAIHGIIPEYKTDIADIERLMVSWFGESEDDLKRFNLNELPESFCESAVKLKHHTTKLATSSKTLTELLKDNALLNTQQKAWQAQLNDLLDLLTQHNQLWHNYANNATTEHIPYARWMRRQTLTKGDLSFSLHLSPVLASEALKKSFWQRAAGVVITSATLTALSSFSRFKMQTGCPDNALYKRYLSPFDFNTQSELAIPKDFPKPQAKEAHTKALAASLPGWLKGHKGALVLFSSNQQLQDVFYSLPKRLRSKIILQEDGSKQRLIKKHCTRIDAGKQSILFGLASFAEGIDLPGDYCSHVIIAKLPFSVPDDPVLATLCDWLIEQNQDPFYTVSVADASMRLTQAAGRLLRTDACHGCITLSDSRVLNSQYGKAILAALPPYPVKQIAADSVLPVSDSR